MGKKEYYLSVAEAIIVEARVRHVVYVDRQLRAYAGRELRGEKRRFIVLPRPTTLKRLITLAHEAGHVYLKHGRSVPSYRREFEAIRFCETALKRHGVEFDEAEHLRRGQVYVASKIRMGRGLLKRLCRDSFDWAEEHLKKSRGGREVLSRVAVGEIELVTLDRPDPTAAPKARTRSLDVTFYDAPSSWVGREKAALVITRGNKAVQTIMDPNVRVQRGKAEGTEDSFLR